MSIRLNMTKLPWLSTDRRADPPLSDFEKAKWLNNYGHYWLTPDERGGVFEITLRILHGHGTPQEHEWVQDKFEMAGEEFHGDMEDYR